MNRNYFKEVKDLRVKNTKLLGNNQEMFII